MNLANVPWKMVKNSKLFQQQQKGQTHLSFILLLIRRSCAMLMIFWGGLIQVKFCQKFLFLHQLTHNMTTDWSLNYKFNIWKFQAQNMGRTCCVQKLFLKFRTIYVHNMFSPCSAKSKSFWQSKGILVKIIKKSQPLQYDRLYILFYIWESRTQHFVKISACNLLISTYHKYLLFIITIHFLIFLTVT